MKSTFLKSCKYGRKMSKNTEEDESQLYISLFNYYLEIIMIQINMKLF